MEINRKKPATKFQWFKRICFTVFWSITFIIVYQTIYAAGQHDIENKILTICNSTDQYGNPKSGSTDLLAIHGDGCRVWERGFINRYAGNVTKWKNKTKGKK